MPVHTIPIYSGKLAPFIVCDKRDDTSRVLIPVSHFEQWQVSGDSIVDLLAGLLKLQRSNMGGTSAGRREIRLFQGAKHGSHLVLLAGNKLTLTLASHSIALTEVIPGFPIPSSIYVFREAASQSPSPSVAAPSGGLRWKLTIG